ncbi:MULTISPECIES: GNAT family N-acetyltransferase [Hyphomonas]|uniref:GNAT family N-acetyltransferase n=1 Tax=Hyphomonas adhaerens TaxID=81029 RepID=A0A3B9GY26_9PROT|nr:MULTISPECIES: GNAT family N-acetyltransferase [Hyphomonas]MBB39346.1 GNAT family N-acetyltransferase [Hyphomonas sp.]HAE27353.1 GNAT family N-acetyltransferase [Hyphomonas adhaerens]|tara:strand:+ start:2403 stop:2891 length:489 start_codon:yes stop_codon:yes gene_type:complete
MTTIRAYAPSDLPALHAINEQGVPGVSRETIKSLAKWLSLSECLVAVDDTGRPIGFLNLVPPGTAAYTSDNLRWFEARAGNANYVDRIAIDASARGQRIGEALYEAAFAACAGRYDSIGCEVNRVPPNPGSLRFHKRLGFVEVGAQAFVPGKKEVIYLERAL